MADYGICYIGIGTFYQNYSVSHNFSKFVYKSYHWTDYILKSYHHIQETAFRQKT